MTGAPRPGPIERIHVYGSYFVDRATPDVLGRLADREIVGLVDDDAFLEALPEIEVLFGYGMPARWERATSLRLIQWPGAGVDALLPAVGLRPDVVVANARGTHDPAMPEFVIASLLAMAYRIPTLVRQQDQRRWKISIPRPLSGRTLCVVGLGTIGRSIAARAAALGMTVTGVRRSGAPVDGVTRVATPSRRLDALHGADAVAVVTPLTDETQGLIGKPELDVLADGALLVDVSRGGVSDIDAVVAALGSGRLAGATMDVFATEPLPSDSPLWDVDGLFVTPHTAGYGPNWIELVFDTLADSVDAIEAGRRPLNTVDVELGY